MTDERFSPSSSTTNIQTLIDRPHGPLLLLLLLVF